MPSNSKWQRVNRQRPCPICERPDWCLYAGDHDHPEAAICARIESAKPCGEAGWLHRLRNEQPVRSSRRRMVCVSLIQPEMVNGGAASDLARLSEEFRQAVSQHDLRHLASELDLSADSLLRLRIGYWVIRHAWTFPMFDADGNVLGIRLRFANGQKLSVRGGHEGLFVPEGLEPGGQLLIAEGPTDVAALLDLGFPAVGRPSCSGGVKLLVQLVRKLVVPELVIVADGDAPGQRGAENLASALLAYSTAVRVIAPPIGAKDAREWKRRGATVAEVRSVIEATPVRRLKICMKGGQP